MRRDGAGVCSWRGPGGLLILSFPWALFPVCLSLSASLLSLTLSVSLSLPLLSGSFVDLLAPCAQPARPQGEASSSALGSADAVLGPPTQVAYFFSSSLAPNSSLFWMNGKL